MARNIIRSFTTASVGIAALSIGLATGGTAAAATTSYDGPTTTAVAGTGSASGSSSLAACIAQQLLFQAPTTGDACRDLLRLFA